MGNNLSSRSFFTSQGNPKMLQHHSIHSRVRATMIFHNETNLVVAIYWCSYNGTKIRYVYLLPDSFYEQPSYLTHPWQFEVNYLGPNMPPFIDFGSEQAIVYPQSETASTLVRIQLAKRVLWNTTTHMKEDGFHSYRSVVRTVLLIHHRYQSSQHSDAHHNTSDHKLKSSCTIGRLSMDVLLMILEIAAPIVYARPRKPRFPEGALREWYTDEEYRELFRHDDDGDEDGG